MCKMEILSISISELNNIRSPAIYLGGRSKVDKLGWDTFTTPTGPLSVK